MEKWSPLLCQFLASPPVSDPEYPFVVGLSYMPAVDKYRHAH